MYISNWKFSFVNQLELILNKICKTSTEIIMCGDLNINYFNDNSKKHVLDCS